MKHVANRRAIRAATGAAAAVALVAGLAGCAGDSEPNTSGDADGTPIVIGGTLGLTGAFSAASEGYEVAYDYWADEINENGGLLGRPVEFKIFDDESTPATAAQLYQQLINEDGADLLVAPYTTGVGGAIVPITERAGKIVFNPGFLGQEIHADADMLVSAWPYQEPQAADPFFDFLASLPEAERGSTIAITTGQHPFLLAAKNGVAGVDGIVAKAEAAGYEVVLDEEYAMTTTDFTALAQKVKDSGADVYLAVALVNDGVAIAQAVNNSGYTPDWYCSCGSQVTTQTVWPDLGAAGENVFATANVWANQGYPGLEDTLAGMAEAFNTTPELIPGYAPVAYAALQVLQQAVEATDSLDDQTLRDYIADNSFDTIIGTFSYNADGTTKGISPVLLQYQADGNQPIWPTDIATAEAVTPY